ncbi:3549_t:CDS:2 [Funneliformis caledonium]|uniref:3549_t:CDS:1 n=1 Tax=Funneliformis caledonium TaxID=1117310 RepID=A0A9N8WPG8_9GLOM|nr:3549_t:CDS:2 [Funneliformis caledonium]
MISSSIFTIEEFHTLTEILLALTGGILIFMNGRNINTFVVLLKLLDFVSNVAFLINTINTDPDLFFPSFVMLAVPAVFNLLLVLGVMMQQTQQINKREFRGWLRKNIIMTTIITILSMVDIVNMKLLVDITIFDPPVRKWLLVAGIFNIIKELPQFVILVQYIKDVGLNMFIILTIFTSFISLLFSLIYEIYEKLSSDLEVSHIV